MQEETINTKGTFQPSKYFPKSRIVFDKENIYPINPHFCPICGRITNSKGSRESIGEYGFCGLCLTWWKDEEKITIDKSLEYKLNKYIDYVDRYGNCKLGVDWNNMTYKSVIKE